MSKYTREQIQKARDAADNESSQYGMSTNEERAWINAFAEALGLELEDEKPEPGTWHVVKDGPQVGDAARVDEDGYLHVIGSNGKTLRDIHPDNPWPALTPARVVPAEPVELSETEVGALWDAIPGSRGRWREYTTPFQEHVTAVVNAAPAKNGHGRVEVSREEVLAVVKKGIYETPWSEDRNEAVTNAVMELLEASK